VRTLETIREVRDALAPLRPGSRIGLVPTMGAFHAGHESLFAAARAECDVVVVSLFVNPMQFGEAVDLESYPRSEERDAGIAAEAGVDLLFVPPVAAIYPEGFQTWIEVTELGSILEGAFRPGHFRAVATVCCKLFNIVQPDVAYFGQKDAQQVEVVRRVVRDLDLEVELRVLPTVRDEDGIALSSRNALLSPVERERVAVLPRALATRDPDAARRMLNGFEVDYVEVAQFDPPVLAAAVRVDGIRLIDNVVLTKGAHE
jgi:pantoate--beta-alanine ligase